MKKLTLIALATASCAFSNVTPLFSSADVQRYAITCTMAVDCVDDAARICHDKEWQVIERATSRSGKHYIEIECRSPGQKVDE